jgi:hypothetical protein
MREECLTVHNLNRYQIEQVENDGLEGENMFKFMYEVDSGDLGLNKTPTEFSCIQARNERDHQSNFKRGSRSLIQVPRKSRSSVDRVVCS